MRAKHNPGDKMVIGIYRRPVKVKIIELALWRRSNTIAYLAKEVDTDKTHWLQYNADGQLRKV